MKIKLLLFVMLLSFVCCASINGNIGSRDSFNNLKKQFVNLDLYTYKIIHIESQRYGVPKKLVCAIGQVESGWKNVIGKKNSNGTYDFGYMQVNSVHRKSNPYELLNPKTNIQFACSYLAICYKKARGDIKLTAYYYNRGYMAKLKGFNKSAYKERVYKQYFS
jgi:soluble lytic murein transglycosylase-like protein